MIDVLGLDVGNDFCRSNSKKAIIDSGTSFLLLSAEAFSSLWSAISGYCFSTFTGVFCPCVSAANEKLYPKINVYAYGAKFTLNGYDYILASDVNL